VLKIVTIKQYFEEYFASPVRPIFTEWLVICISIFELKAATAIIAGA
jgi:hypothetical protein